MQENKWAENPGLDQTNEMFEAAVSAVLVKISHTTEKRGAKRKLHQMKWTTVARQLRRDAKAARERQEGASHQDDPTDSGAD